jgi:hypothetical protein
MNLHPCGDMSTDESLIEYEVDGALAALMMIHLAVEPYPLSPLLVLACCYPSADLMGRDPTFYESIIPDCQTNERFKVLLHLQHTDIINRSADLALVVAEYMSMPVGVNHELISKIGT